jgi:hypothetical protein
VAPVLLEPPEDWQGTFLALSEECQIKGDMDTVFSAVKEFFERMMKRGGGRS